jgi:hypothetical protein
MARHHLSADPGICCPAGGETLDGSTRVRAGQRGAPQPGAAPPLPPTHLVLPRPGDRSGLPSHVAQCLLGLSGGGGLGRPDRRGAPPPIEVAEVPRLPRGERLEDAPRDGGHPWVGSIDAHAAVRPMGDERGPDLDRAVVLVPPETPRGGPDGHLQRGARTMDKPSGVGYPWQRRSERCDGTAMEREPCLFHL